MINYEIVSGKGDHLGRMTSYGYHYTIGDSVLAYFDYMREFMERVADCVGNDDVHIVGGFHGHAVYSWDEAIEEDEEWED